MSALYSAISAPSASASSSWRPTHLFSSLVLSLGPLPVWVARICHFSRLRLADLLVLLNPGFVSVDMRTCALFQHLLGAFEFGFVSVDSALCQQGPKTPYLHMSIIENQTPTPARAS